MKIISLQEASNNLAKYGKLCQRDPILVTIKGEPVFKMVPYREGEDAVVDGLLRGTVTSHPKPVDKKKKGIPMDPQKVLKELRSREQMDKRRERP